MTKLAPSTRPWHVGAHYKSDVESPRGRVCECSIMRGPQGQADAAFIVKAANCHDALLVALKAARQFLDPEIDRGPAINGWENTVDLVEAAIAIAERKAP